MAPDDATIAEIRADVKYLVVTLEEVKEQVKKTNGRVTVLELWQAGLEGAKHANSWRGLLALALIPSIISGCVVAAFAALLS